MGEREQKLEQLARESLMLARNTLLVHLRFLDMALSMHTLVPIPGEGCIATNGKYIFYDPVFVLKRFRAERGRVPRDYLHTVLHSVFRHMFIGSLVERRLWNLACDIAVENMILELDIHAIFVKDEPLMKREAASLLSSLSGLTAERIYRYLLDTPLSEAQLQALECLFFADCHDVWYLPDKYGAMIAEAMQGEPDASASMDGEGLSGAGTDALEAEWKRIAERLQEDLETFSRQQGDRAGSMMQNLRELNRERYDYTAFLKKFAVPTEVMRVNDDEFDYVFYTYGLEQYKNMPLIEPLEFKDEKRIREFVIAIDTSGSASGELVQAFVQKTYNVLKSAETFSTKINVHIIQCDADIQEDVKITSQEEFDAYIKRMKILGLGGTDFRPVFSYVERLMDEKEFTNLKGLIYFTDGMGTFPEKMPPYPTAFVYIDEGFNDFTVPPWAIRLVLRKDEI